MVRLAAAVTAACVAVMVVLGVGAVNAQPLPPRALLPQGSPLPRVLLPIPADVGPGLGPPQPRSLDKILPGATIEVTHTELRGMTAYPPGQFDSVMKPLVGIVEEGQVEQVRLAILRTYRADGYIFTAVTAALEQNRKLVFTATEGRIVDVKLDGNIGPAGVQVMRFLGHLTETSPLNINDLERWLLLAKDIPGITIQSFLRPSASDPSALSLVAQVSRESVSGLLTADNRGYKGTGPEQVLASISANSLTEYGERTDATLFYTARKTVLFGQVATELFLGASGLKMRVYAGKGTNDPTGSLSQLGYHGETISAGTSLSYPLIRRRQKMLNLNASLDALQSHTSTGLGSSAALTNQDNLRVVRLGADYASHDMLLGDARGAVNSFSLRVSRGLTGFGASAQGSALAGRSGERIDFTKGALEAARTQALFSPFDDATLDLLVLAAGQYSQDVLPSAEKFSLGGARLNRGFYAGELTGDRAISLSVEPQLNTGFTMPDLLGGFDVGMQAYAFYDWGETWESRRSDQNARVGSAGLGVRMFLPKNIELDVEAVNRLTRRPQGTASTVAALQSSGVYWRLIGRF